MKNYNTFKINSESKRSFTQFHKHNDGPRVTFLYALEFNNLCYEIPLNQKLIQ